MKTWFPQHKILKREAKRSAAHWGYDPSILIKQNLNEDNLKLTYIPYGINRQDKSQESRFAYSINSGWNMI